MCGDVNDLAYSPLFDYIKNGGTVLVNATVVPNPWIEFYTSALWYFTFQVFHGTWATANILTGSRKLYLVRLYGDNKPLFKLQQAIYCLLIIANFIRLIAVAVGGLYSTGLLPDEAQCIFLTLTQPFELAAGKRSCLP